MPDPRSLTFIAPFALPLLVEDAPGGPGGAERQFVLFARCLSQRGWKISFIVAKPRGEVGGNSPILTVHYADFSYLGGNKARIPFDWMSLLRAMRASDSKYYAVKVPGHLLSPMRVFRRVVGGKIIFWSQRYFDAHPRERTGMKQAANLLQDWGLRGADVIIAQTEDQRRGFKENYGIESTVVPSICRSLGENSSSREATVSSEKKFDVLWAGNSTPNKRQEIFFELAGLLPRRSFAMALNKSDPRRFEEARENAKKLPNVFFLGAVPPRQMESRFREARIFLNTSEAEGFPNTFLQAWTNGIPVVSLCIDPDGIIQRFNLGRVTGLQKIENSKDCETMARLPAQAIDELLVDSDLRASMGENAKCFVENRHAPDVVVPQLISALETA